jgi:pyruvate/2-oxoglutarate dehydrogenase complex dihydrolipoamide dehydrogenase (E3) component
MPVQLLPDDAHDRQLLQHVCPPAWQNPTPSGRYNLVVIGAGTAGLVTAAGAAGLGAKVALVERELMGGDCLNVGCVPSKALLSAARAAAAVKRAGEFGVRVPDGVSVDFAAVMERLRRLRASIAPNDSAERFRSLGVDVYLGEARFTSRDAVEVAGQTLRFKKAVIATGARAARPDIPGLAEAGFLTNENVFALMQLPRRLAVIGGGPIGCELAQAFALLGSSVTLLERSAQILSRDDRDAAEVLTTALIHDGVQLWTESKLLYVELASGEKVLHVERAGKTERLIVDEVLVGTGRAPNVAGLNLEAVGVAYDNRSGIHVNDRLQTTNPRIFAAGDVCSSYKFTHAADFMARIVIQNALFFGRAKASALIVPWCTYTSPEVAQVGLGEHDARALGIPIEAHQQNLDHVDSAKAARGRHGFVIFRQDLMHVDRAILAGDRSGFVKVLVQRGTDRIVGATIVAEHAGEMIGELVLAMKAGIGLKTLAATIHPYPTVAEAIRKIGDQYNRTRLRPFVKQLFATWLAWRR